MHIDEHHMHIGDRQMHASQNQKAEILTLTTQFQENGQNISYCSGKKQKNNLNHQELLKNRKIGV